MRQKLQLQLSDMFEYMDLRESNKKWTKNVDHVMSTNDYVCNVQCAMLLKC